MAPAAGQSDLRASGGAQAIGVVTAVDPIPGGGSLTEVRVVQGLVRGGLTGLSGHLTLHGTLNLESLTMPRGELLPGGWGEGFYDRRHPHTTVHELMLTGLARMATGGGSVRLALSAGKGFVPFGSDDPMTRPVFRYPANHHLAQVLERAVVLAGVRAGPAVLEAGLFNGDEPERPGQWPNWDRFGDSWSGRLTLLPLNGMEVAVSRAKVHSPEHRPGAGTDAWKWHLGVRQERRTRAGDLLLFAEWARTEEAAGFFAFRSLLGEAAWWGGRHRAWYRFERTERPEDARTEDLFRSLRPHLEDAIMGITRFTLHTAGYGLRVAAGGVEIEPFVEGTVGRMAAVSGGVFRPAAFYGTSRVRALSAGIRVSTGLAGHRMGRYGGLLSTPAGEGDHAH